MIVSLTHSRRPVLLILFAGILAAAGLTALAQDSPAPESVTIAGTIQSVLGCSGDWMPECEETFLTYETEDDLWMATWTVPAGDYLYKAALNASWDPENYGLNAEDHGQDIPLSLAEETKVTFFYDHKTHWVTDSVNSLIAAAGGDFQDELGCSADWRPDCLRSWLQDTDGDGVYTFTTTAIPAGEWSTRIGINQSWAENYGADGELKGTPVSFSIPAAGHEVTISFDSASHLIEITVSEDVVAEVVAEPTAALVAPGPESVTIAGTIQSVSGCSGDWQPECESTFLTYDPADDLWFGSWDLPAGSYKYKAALNASWEPENYGMNAENHGADIPLELAEDGTVQFFYDHKTHWVTDSVNSIIANVSGDFQDEIGCPGDWAPDCLRSWLQDPDGDGMYVFSTPLIPAGDWEAKVALNQSWDLNYGADAEQNGANITLSVPAAFHEVMFTFDSVEHTLDITVSAEPVAAPGEVGPVQIGNLQAAKAQWVTADTIAWEIDPAEGATFQLHYAADGGLALEGGAVSGGETIALTYDENGLSEDILADFPHLAAYSAFKLTEADLTLVPDMLKGQTAVSVTGSDGALLDATSLQIPGVLDDLYTYDGQLGVIYDGDVPTLKVWAPTAKSVTLHLFDNPDADTTSQTFPMELDTETGVWTVTGTPEWTYKYYLYEVEVYAPSTGQIEHNLVTDPYSLSLSMNSTRSQIVDLLNDTSLMPPGWLDVTKPPLEVPEDIVLYELHIRDFSVNDPTVPDTFKGTYMAFTVADSYGMQHLRNLAASGLTHIHLLPAFDIATINEDKSTWVQPDREELTSYPPDSDQQQALISPIRDEDAFNWGYDPYHYTTPEGSYATNPNGTTRILQFRRMVQALNESDLRLVMDVVYNHTNASGQNERSVLDKVVPGYYHRLNASGAVETSTCCQNTATEHAMMEKLMIDSLTMWAKAYKVDGFRFDLMGHHMVENMANVRAALDGLTPEADGVNGSEIYVYGEGWNFGEVLDNARGVNATQLNIGGLGIGTFNDRIRDAARGGSPFGDRTFQGFVNGLWTDPNGLTGGTDEEQRARLLHFADQIRVGLAGNLRDYTFVNAEGETVTGAEIDYNGSPTGYTLDPQEHIVYIEAHDNETLFDKIQYAAPANATVEDRVRMQNMGISIVALSQGVPFYHAGAELLRSKSMDRNSYNSGDWFNTLDYSYQTNNWAVGLPPADPNEESWPMIQPLLANPDIRPGPEHILMSVNHLQEMLRIRKSSPLFRLQTAEDIQNRLVFLNTGPEQIPGLIVMTLADTGDLENIDPNYDQIVVVFNATDEEITFSDESLADMPFELHPVQINSADPVVQTASADGGTFTVPARTTAVFVVMEGNAE